MDIAIRPVGDEQLDTFDRAVGAGCSYHSSDEELVQARERYHRGFDRRIFAAFDGEQIVATGINVPMAITLPGGASLPMAAVTAITTRPTHRRRGLVTSMIGTLIDDAAAHGDPIAGLWASESVIYGRFGYGIAIEADSWELERQYAAFESSVAISGSVRMVDTVADARAAYEQVWQRAHAAQPGMPKRTDRMWDVRLMTQGEGTIQFAVLYEEAGRCDGYAFYRVRPDSRDGLPQNEVIIQELVTVTDAAHAALWRFVCSIDLSKTIRASNRAVDDPLLWMLADPRRLARRTRDAIWLRIIDVPRTLEARTYGISGALVLDVVDAFRPQSGGRFRLDSDGVHATCVRTDAAPDLKLSAADLAAIYLGGTSCSVLARAGRIEEHTAGALRTADLLFATERAPWCPQGW
ncbi:MAG: GNAT family N-acetyltransferase [Chloroflexi bacterium]|nr:MAG: GNAT family N-acetyltransferase [Chloroflexota bacterium]